MYKYCKNTTANHKVSEEYPTCICSIKKIIIREGGKGRIFSDDHVIDLDKVASEKARGVCSPCATMDIFLGVSQQKENSEERFDNRSALVEFKFSVQNPRGLKKTELENKVKGSIQTLGCAPPVLHCYYFVFNLKKVSEARAHFNRIFLGKLNNLYKTTTEAELHKIYW